MKILTKKQAEIKLSNNLPKDIVILSDIFNKSGFDLFLCGGSIRDTFLNKIPKDFDVCTNILPDQVVLILEQNNIKFQLQGEAFGIVVAKMNEDIEIATFRSDISANTGKNSHDSVKFGVTIEDDAKRRDFTINALFFDINKSKIIDLVGGINDLNDGIIRTVGNPIDRFLEDDLRKLRCIRFSNRFGFSIHGNVFKSIVNNPKLNVSKERIVNELEMMFNSCLSIDMLIFDLFTTNIAFEIFEGLNLHFDNNSDRISRDNFATFLNEFILPNQENLESKLFKLNFSSKTINSILFLQKWDIPTKDIDVVTFQKEIKTTNLSNENILKTLGNNFKFLLDFVMPKDLVPNLISQGFKGKDLGLKISEECKKLLNDN